MAAKIRVNKTDNSSSPISVTGTQCLLVVQYGNNGRGRGVEECEMFTIPGLHKEMRNRGRRTTERWSSVAAVK